MKFVLLSYHLKLAFEKLKSPLQTEAISPKEVVTLYFLFNAEIAVSCTQAFALIPANMISWIPKLCKYSCKLVFVKPLLFSFTKVFELAGANKDPIESMVPTKGAPTISYSSFIRGIFFLLARVSNSTIFEISFSRYLESRLSRKVFCISTTVSAFFIPT